MESLEELKAIIAGKQDGDMFYCDGQYLDHRLDVRSKHTKYAINGTTYYFNYQQPVSVMMNKLRLLSDIERIIELMEWQSAFSKKYKHIVEAML
jgi:hypothetical protein